ncbi:unnamed protein product, partial [Rotaria socialis]
FLDGNLLEETFKATWDWIKKANQNNWPGKDIERWRRDSIYKLFEKHGNCVVLDRYDVVDRRDDDVRDLLRRGRARLARLRALFVDLYYHICLCD